MVEIEVRYQVRESVCTRAEFEARYSDDSIFFKSRLTSLLLRGVAEDDIVAEALTGGIV